MLLAVIAAASMHARVADVRLVSAERHSALQMTIDGGPAQVVVRRDGDLTRVLLPRTGLGLTFSGGDRFQWLWTPGPEGSGPRQVHCPEAIWIERGTDEVTVSLRLPPEVSIEPRQEGSAVILIFRAAPLETTIARRQEPLPSPPSTPTPEPVPVVPTRAPERTPEPTPVPSPATAEATEPAPPAVGPSPTPATATSDLVAQLLSTLSSPSAEVPLTPSTEPAPLPTETPAPSDSTSSSPSTTSQVAQLIGTLSGSNADASITPAPVGENTPTEDVGAESLYARLFPQGTPAPTPSPTPEAGGNQEARPEHTFRFGFLTLRPALHLAYLDSTASLLDSTDTVRDRYLEIRPGLKLGTSLMHGRLQAQYEPSLRSFGNFGPTESTSHRASVSLDLASRGPIHLSVRDAFATGVLETQEVDPGGEYFFDLQRFWRNSVGATVGHEIAPRWTLNGGARLDEVQFDTAGSFFDHETWSFDFGVDHEISENLHTTASYVYDRVPHSDDRPQAESTASTVQATLTGQATPRVTAQLTLGYRDQEHPFAPEPGRRYRGLVVGGSATRTLGLASSLTLSGSRTALLSAFEDNGFYVTNLVQTTGVFRFPYGLFLDAGTGYRWNDYRTIAREIGVPRADTIFDWHLGLRRPLRWGSIGAGYQRQRRRSNVDRFDVTTDGVILQLDVDVLGAAGLR
jgi:hypothetical protein